MAEAGDNTVAVVAVAVSGGVALLVPLVTAYFSRLRERAQAHEEDRRRLRTDFWPVADEGLTKLLAARKKLRAQRPSWEMTQEWQRELWAHGQRLALWLPGEHPMRAGWIEVLEAFGDLRRHIVRGPEDPVTGEATAESRRRYFERLSELNHALDRAVEAYGRGARVVLGPGWLPGGRRD